MESYKVTTLKMGTLIAEKSQLTYGRDFGLMIEDPMWATAVEGNGIRAIIDTGIHDVGWVQDKVGDLYEVSQGDDETMAGALAKIGWTPDDVNVVINTHLHYDHCDNNYLFRNAVFYTQRAEYEWSFNADVEYQRQFYAPFLYDWQAVEYPRWRVLNGEHEIAPGFRLIPLPGHTPGSQGAFINTDEGVLCVAGDSCNMVENVTDNVPPNIIWNFEEAYRSLETIRSRADRVMPGHDKAIRKYQSSAFPKVR